MQIGPQEYDIHKGVILLIDGRAKPPQPNGCRMMINMGPRANFTFYDTEILNGIFLQKKL